VTSLHPMYIDSEPICRAASNRFSGSVFIFTISRLRLHFSADQSMRVEDGWSANRRERAEWPTIE